MKRILRSAAVLLVLQGFFACSDKQDKPPADTSIPKDTPAPIPSDPNQQTTSALQVEAKTFEVKDAKGKRLGWGYDLYVNGKRTIRQEIIPGIQGNNYFKTEEDAQRTGTFAAKRMSLTGAFPTIQPNELDSLGVWKMK